MQFSLEGDAHEPSVVAFFGLVDAADAVIGPGEFHAWGSGGGGRRRSGAVREGTMAMGTGAGKREGLGSGLIDEILLGPEP